MAGAERAGEPHGRRRSAGGLRRRVPEDRDAVNPEGRARTAGARSDAGASSGARASGGEDQSGALRAVTTYMRVNPQVFVLLVICLVLGLGTFLAVVFGLLTAGSDQTTGEPSGAVLGVHLLEPATARLML